MLFHSKICVVVFIGMYLFHTHEDPGEWMQLDLLMLSSTWMKLGIEMLFSDYEIEHIEAPT